MWISLKDFLNVLILFGLLTVIVSFYKLIIVRHTPHPVLAVFDCFLAYFGLVIDSVISRQ